MKESTDPEEQRIYDEISNKVFLTKLKGTVNGLIPYQLNRKELETILNNASAYWQTLNNIGDDGISVKDKIISLFTFKIPYYVGPLNTNSERAWVSRTNEKIYPWNFSKIVDEKKSAENFMKNLVGHCTYTGDRVLPLNSLIYSKYMVLNEINNIKVNGKQIPVEIKQKLYNDLFVDSNKKVTKKKIQHYFLANGLIEASDEVTGIDDDIKGSLKSYHDFKDILDRTNDAEQVENIIERVLIFGNDKKMLKGWLKDNTKGLKDQDIRMILHLNYSDWGRLSKTFLTGIYHINGDGEAFNIMDMLWNTNCNLMQLNSSQYQFALKAEEYRKEHNSIDVSLHARLNEMYIAPSVRRSIWQTMRIVDEIVDIEKAAPAKVFIEMARDSSKMMKGKRTESRKDALMKLYSSCKKQETELYGKLQSETDQTLRRDKLYLYYTQLGRCMYSGEPIDLDKLLHDDTTYDIDHIFPRSRIKDDSLKNRVLVQSKLNRDKTNTYPISDDVRKKMMPFWTMLFEKKLIDTEKYERLKRNYPLTEEELSSFIARQLTVTQQSTKALAEIINETYPSTRIVYSKAGNVSEFRREFEIPKFRDINDLHHAKDAYLNIVVGNVYSTKFTDQFFKNIQSENYSLNRVFDFDTQNAWDAPTTEQMKAYRLDIKNKVLNAHEQLGGTFKTVYKYVYKNTPIVTFAEFQYKGSLFDVTIKKKGLGQYRIKNNHEISKYGGYNNIYASYYFIAEFRDNDIKVRKILPVYLAFVNKYERDPIAYCIEILKLDSPTIIVKNIKANSLLELNGVRYRMTGRSNDSILCQHDYQLAISDKYAKYLKRLKIFIDRTRNVKDDYSDFAIEIDKDKNIEMFDWMIAKLNSKIYKSVYSNISEKVTYARDNFIMLDVKNQATVLIEIIKLFRCNSSSSDLSAISLAKNAGKMNRNRTVNNFVDDKSCI